MSGHSKWSTIKRKKGAADAKRGAAFSRLSKDITLAAREGRGLVEMNPALRLALKKAKSSNMPSANIDRAIKKGTGELPGIKYDDFEFEGYGPHSVAILIEVMTDNKNRTLPEIRSIMAKNGGNLAESGAVSWNFETKGVIDVNADKDSVEDISMEGIDAGAIDVDVDESNITFYTTYQNFENVKKFLESNDSVNIDRSEIELVPNTFAEVDKSLALKTMKLLEKLEDLDDVQKVFSNLNITNELIDDFE